MRSHSKVDITNLSKSYLEEAKQTVLSAILPPLVESLLDHGDLELDKLHDLHYVWRVVNDNRNLIGEIEAIYHLDNELMEAAQATINLGYVSAAVILVATVVEHRLNIFYRDMLTETSNLPSKMITEVIKNTLPAKLGWLFKLITNEEIPEETLSSIRSLTELRNTIVHYKAIPDENLGAIYEENSLFTRLDNIDTDALTGQPDRLSSLLDNILNEVRPHRIVAATTAEAMLSVLPKRTAAEHPL